MTKIHNSDLFYQDKSLEGFSQCYGCKQKGIWNVSWSCMMWVSKENGHHYCDECKEELSNEVSIR